MENQNEIIEITIKAIFLGEFHDWNSWLKNTEKAHSTYGVTHQIFHQDCNGYKTSGYDLRNTHRENIYPVKTFLLVSDPGLTNTFPVKSPSNN
ncbi:hypothetical protein GJU43_15040 [Flavobacterium sp. LC2016-23]|uniref:hypothetical protein n=1 Tax=Flavobacterium sp. LC2016-23 TaxID=2666330 RepID=UPI0012B0B98A|nr:hypothetical protein [Flavobacterium sp. LC2016-23]MRX40601.1 hypothetical protein [Flavobacterium sp. LC2016-23]